MKHLLDKTAQLLKAITVGVVGGVVAGLEKKYAIQVDHNQITRIVTDYLDKLGG